MASPPARLKLGVINNPLSQQNKRGLAGIEAVARDAGVLDRRLETVAELGAVLDDFAAREVGLIVVNGGDGTVQAVLTELLERRPFAEPPPLALLSGGMTNMTANDVGLRGRPARALGRLIAAAREGSLGDRRIERRVLRLENARGLPPQRGMFFGAGGITQAIRYCRAKVHPLRLQANWAAGATLFGLMLGWLLRGARGGALSGNRIAVSLEDGPLDDRERLLVLATTLDRLVLGARPFWNQGGQPIRYTAIDYPPRRLLRAAPRVLYGAEQREAPAQGYDSCGAGRLAMTLDSPFTLDGQILEPMDGQPILLTAPETVNFLRC
jgi:hypothetical protein